MTDLVRTEDLTKRPIDLGMLFSVLRKRKWLILSVALGVPLVVVFMVGKEPKVFEASVSLVIDATAPQYLGQGFKDVVELETNWFSQQETLQTELRVIKSHSQAQAVASALCQKRLVDGTPLLKRVLATHLLDPSCDTPAQVARAATALQLLMRADPVPQSRIVQLVASLHDAEMAALLANTAAQVYTDRTLERRLSQSVGAATWLSDEFSGLTSQLNEAERSLIEFKRKNNVVAVAIEDQQNDLTSKHKKLADELNAVEVKLIALRAQREQYAGLKSEDPMTQVSPGIADNPVVIKLKELYVEQYAKLLELRGKYLDRHPAIIAQEARVASIRGDLVREAGVSVKNVEAHYATALREEHELRAMLGAVTREALQLEQRAIEYNRLKRNFDRVQKLSEQVGGRESETSLAGHLRTNNVRILDAALIPTTPVAPNVPRAAAIGLVVGLFLAGLLTFFVEMLNWTVKSQDDVEKHAGLAFLGLIPIMEVEGKPNGESGGKHGHEASCSSKDLYLLEHPKSAVAECCRAIRTNLLFMSPDKPAKSLLITSTGPQEGKSTTAISLAITMAQSGLKVLLVDTDMRRPRLHKVFNVPATGYGLSAAIVGEADVTQVICETMVPGLWLLPCGATPPNPAELLHAARFRRIVDELSKRYDRLVFDSPPVGAVTDAAILARLTDGTILVAKSGRTWKETLGRARRELSEGGVNVLGCILNRIDISQQAAYGYSYYYSKYGYGGGYYRDQDSPATKPAA